MPTLAPMLRHLNAGFSPDQRGEVFVEVQRALTVEPVEDDALQL